MNRREWLQTAAVSAPGLLGAASLGCQRATPTLFADPIGQLANGNERKADVVIIGGGLGGIAAALAVLRRGATVILTEPSDWIGGQLTAQAVPPDEHRWIESFGCTRSYRQLREGIRSAYRQSTTRPLKPALRAKRELNPGNGWVSRLCHEPKVALAVLEGMLAPYREKGQLQLLLNWEATGCDLGIDRIRAVQGIDLPSGKTTTLLGSVFLDATEQGDLLPLAKAEFVTGFESRKQTGEPRAPLQAQPTNLQGFTVCFALEYCPGEDHTIDKPAEYDFWRNHVPKTNPPYLGKLLSWEHPNLPNRRYGFDPTSARTPEGPNLWTYRRILDANQFQPGTLKGDVSIINWPQNDYFLGALHAVPENEAEMHLARARQLSLCVAYWLQTEAPRSDGKAGWKGLKLAGEYTGTRDGLAKMPYIRESRRIQAEFTIVEQQIRKELRRPFAKDGMLSAEHFADSVGIGHYAMDLHPSTFGNPNSYVEACPFQIPLGALIPIRLENLLAAGKNLGVTHLTNGCYRLHPVEWNIGEAAGAVAVASLKAKVPPRQIRKQLARLDEFQGDLRKDGFELEWPDSARLQPAEPAKPAAGG
ncbi:FAD-dependent oxidoreductase [Tuwongella immobilis]|uniref:FAD-dependent oxidoreductase n=1 Tax=Tuwongella immobilis TaxID=692036 RepID=A0A6C2YSC2_9BACT|nr:FAD-dependent oxidoreductase [Tuwongella immobilis]VIP04366.1 NAD(FAD)-dependent dehydrogenase OS=Singulisphaera acidiphila (strain ATCC BAA-1392 / DSM 18658 / VKM B-2454 / MOB10) GN=Sinac_0656 PE=4 SV=1: FAD_oxidored [Tuwongella immobilis]VTS06094.1 NAD(FAD)-dependent dehydrogenase OS=Singulisphaera acidiphila (strain ATCC BAA-1392 / DSM 18658 / VKM B-2454 / MOB10) GN=Sinac_0656 PE=4 SV=1: FAD_oxidored [Tuwongella immobilis]